MCITENVRKEGRKTKEVWLQFTERQSGEN